MDIDVEAVLATAQQLDSARARILRLEADKADLEAEIQHHHKDFKIIQRHLDVIEHAETKGVLEPADMRWALRRIRSTVG